jgi:thioredoxin-related protein
MARPVIRGALSILVVLGVAQALDAGEEVRWRYDYAAARRESQHSGRPLFLDFSTDWCSPCRRLERTTFRDPQVIQLLNDKYIPVKLDGNKEKTLVELLKVQAYPTLLLADPNGQILRTIEGYLEANVLRQHLQDVLEQVAPLASRNQISEPVKLTGVPAASASPAERKRSAELLAQARSDFQHKHYLDCLERCSLLVQEHSKTPEAEEGRRIIQHLKAHPQWMPQACDQLARRLAELHLALGESALQQGEIRTAVEQFERVLAVAPGSASAERARTELAKHRVGAAKSASIKK